MKMFPGGISIIFVSFNYYIVISEENAFGSERLQGKGQDRLGCDWHMTYMVGFLRCWS